MKRKLKTNQLQIEDKDEVFGKCCMRVQGKQGMWIFILVVMVIFIISMGYCYYLGLMDGTFAGIGIMICLIFASICISFLGDCILFYEYGCIHITMFKMRKKRIAYDDIKCILARKLSFKKEQTTMWEITLKDKKKGIRLDASSYKDIQDCLLILARETKIQIIS